MCCDGPSAVVAICVVFGLVSCSCVGYVYVVCYCVVCWLVCVSVLLLLLLLFIVVCVFVLFVVYVWVCSWRLWNVFVLVIVMYLCLALLDSVVYCVDVIMFALVVNMFDILSARLSLFLLLLMACLLFEMRLHCSCPFA